MEYKTRDIVCAATLLYFGAQLKNIELKERRGTFVFDSVEEQILIDFTLGKTLVEPQKFNNNVRFLNTAIAQMNKNQ